MNVGFVTFEKFEGKKDIGSSRIRARWLCNYWDEAEVFVQGQKYDAVIYQKAYWIDHAKNFNGVKILDLCDPDFLHWGYRSVEMMQEVDMLTTSTETLAKQYRQFTDKPVVCVPDRLDLAMFPQKKVHVGDAETVVWFGYSSNFEMLSQAVPSIYKCGYKLLVISDKPYVPPTGYGKLEIEYIKWNEATAFDNILKGDIMVNPQARNNKWIFKSNNKTITAWALGLPVGEDGKDLERLRSESERKAESEKKLIEVQELWDVRKSIEEYKTLIQQVMDSKDPNFLGYLS